MAFSFDADGGTAVARILSDHPDDNGRLVYLHVQYATAIDDAWYDQANDPYSAAIPQTHSGPAVRAETTEDKIQKRGTKRRPPETVPVTSVSTTTEQPDTEFPFPAALPTAEKKLRGGGFSDTEEDKENKDGKANGAPRSILKKTIHFDPLTPQDEQGKPVEPQRKKRLLSTGYKFPDPPKDPDVMSDAEFDAWTHKMTDAEYAEFERYMDDLDAESDDSYGDDELEVLPPPAKRFRPIATDPNPGKVNTPMDLLGSDYFRKYGGDPRNRIQEGDIKRLAANLAYGPRHVPNYTGPKAPTMRKLHEQALHDADRRQMGKEIELFGGDCFRLIPSWPKRECIFIVGQQGAGEWQEWVESAKGRGYVLWPESAFDWDAHFRACFHSGRPCLFVVR